MNPRVAAQRAIGWVLVVCGVVLGGLAGIVLAPFILLAYVGWLLCHQPLRGIWLGMRTTLAGGAVPSEHGDRRQAGGTKRAVGGRAAAHEDMVKRPHQPARSGDDGSARRTGMLVAAGRPKVKRPARPAAAARRAATLTHADFTRSIEAMVRHRWRKEDAVQQLEGLGAQWVWDQASTMVVSPQSRSRASWRDDMRQPGVQATREVRIAYHHRRRWARSWWGTWTREPDIEVMLYLDAQGTLIGGRAWPRKLRLC